MITATSGLETVSSAFAFFAILFSWLFSLIQRETTLAVKCVESLGFDEVVTSVGNPGQQRHDLCVDYFPALRLRQETTTPVIGTEGFRVAAGPNLHATIANHREFDAVAINLADRIAEIVCRSARPVEKDVNADKLF